MTIKRYISINNELKIGKVENQLVYRQKRSQNEKDIDWWCSFKIDKGSKNIKVFEDREQGFKLVSIKHNKNLYLSLFDIRASLKLSSLGNLKSSLKRFEKFSPNEKAVFEVLIIDNRKTIILPFVKDIIIFQFLNTKKYLSRTPKNKLF